VQTLGQASGENDFPRLVQLGSRMAVVWRNAKEVQVYDIEF
jgi:predicted DNA-binding transcriptional regulator AlpA